MKILFASVMLLASGLAMASSVPTNLFFPVKNSAPAGVIYRLEEHPNSVFVFEVYSLGCGDCNNNAVYVDKLAAEYAQNPRVQVLDTGIDTTDAQYAEWIRVHKPNHPVIADPKRMIFNALNTANEIPQAFVVDCNGKMVGNFVNVWKGAGEVKIRQLVETALKTVCQQ